MHHGNQGQRRGPRGKASQPVDRGRGALQPRVEGPDRQQRRELEEVARRNDVPQQGEVSSLIEVDRATRAHPELRQQGEEPEQSKPENRIASGYRPPRDRQVGEQHSRPEDEVVRAGSRRSGAMRYAQITRTPPTATRPAALSSASGSLGSQGSPDGRSSRTGLRASSRRSTGTGLRDMRMGKPDLRGAADGTAGCDPDTAKIGVWPLFVGQRQTLQRAGRVPARRFVRHGHNRSPKDRRQQQYHPRGGRQESG